LLGALCTNGRLTFSNSACGSCR